MDNTKRSIDKRLLETNTAKSRFVPMGVQWRARNLCRVPRVCSIIEPKNPLPWQTTANRANWFQISISIFHNTFTLISIDRNPPSSQSARRHARPADRHHEFLDFPKRKEYTETRGRCGSFCWPRFLFDMIFVPLFGHSSSTTPVLQESLMVSV